MLAVSKVLNFGQVKANNFGRLINSVAMHLHMEVLIIMNNHYVIIMEAVLEHPKKTLSSLGLEIWLRWQECYYLKTTWSVFESNSRNTFCEQNILIRMYENTGPILNIFITL